MKLLTFSIFAFTLFSHLTEGLYLKSLDDDVNDAFNVIVQTIQKGISQVFFSWGRT